MAAYTANYQLHQWVPEDQFRRTDFNQDFQKIDATLAGLKALADGKAGTAALEAVQELAQGRARAVVGGYIGDGFNPREIEVGATPMGLFLLTPFGGYFNLFTGGTVNQLTITSNGFRTETGSLPVNSNNVIYTFLAIV